MKRLFTKALLAVFGFASVLHASAQEMSDKAHPTDSLTLDILYQNLPEVMVKGERPIAKLERGKLSYNIPLLLQRLPADNAFEALANIPGVSQSGGTLSFGSQPVTLIINGKATTMNYEQAVERLKAMPADRLAKAEVMMAAPARYHVRGAAINVVTKDYQGKQVSGQLQSSYQQDKYATGQLQGNLLFVNNKLTLDATYTYVNGSGYSEAAHNVLHPLEDGCKPYADFTTNKTQGIKHNYRLGMDYKIADNHLLGLSYTGKWYSYDSKNHTTGNSVSRQVGDGHNYLHNVDLDYTLPFGLSLTASYTRYEAPEDQWLEGSLYDEERNLHSNSNQTINKWLITADQQHNLAHGWGLSYGAKFQQSNNNSFQTTLDATGAQLPEATSSVDIDERIVNVYLGFSKQISEQVSIDGSVTAENYHTPRWDEWRAYPSLNAIWNVNDRNMLNLSFSSDVTYPSYWSTMSSIYYSSTYSEIWGNPELKPVRSYNLSLMWQLNRRYTFTAFANFEPDFFVQLPYQPTDRMAVIMKMVNFDHRNSYGLQASAQIRAGSWLNGNLFVVGMYTHDKSDDFFDLPFNRKKLTAIVGGVLSAKLSKRRNLRFTVNPFFQSDAIQGVYDIKSLFTLNANLRWSSAKDHWTVVAAGHNLTNRKFRTLSVQGNQHYGMDVRQDWINGSLTVIYKFGNYKQKQKREVDTSRMGH